MNHPSRLSVSLAFVPKIQQLSPRALDGHAFDSVGGEGSSLVNKIDYSDLASILMDRGFDACKVFTPEYTFTVFFRVGTRELDPLFGARPRRFCRPFSARV